MTPSRLRVYYGPEGDTATEAKVESHRVTVPLSEIIPLLADAVESRRTWMRDFEDDEITISADLYGVILAYQHCRRPVA